MVSSTLFSLFMMFFESDEITECFIKSGFIDKEFIYNLKKDNGNITKNICKDKICVCGGAGFPIFNNKQCFTKYFNYLNGRYLHFGMYYISNKYNKITGFFDLYIAPLDDDSDKINYKVYMYTNYNDSLVKYLGVTFNIENNDILFRNNKINESKRLDYSKLNEIHQYINYRNILSHFFI